MSLSTILKKSIYIKNIRAGRKKPGLSYQHLSGIQLITKICQGHLSECGVGSTEIKFHPGDIIGGEFRSDISTAGSTSLLAQIAIPALIFTHKESRMILTGGTNVDFAPPIDFYSEVFKTYMKLFGVDFQVNLHKRGFYPQGGGRVEFIVNPVAKSLSCVNLTIRGAITRVYGIAFVAGCLPMNMAQEMKTTAETILKQNVRVPVEIRTVKEDSSQSFGNGSGIILIAETESGFRLCSSENGKRGRSAHEMGTTAANGLLAELTSSACVDSHMQDQLVIFMALAEGTSSVRVGEITLHTQTAIFVAEQITKVKFSITKEEDDDGTSIISCTGIGFIKQSL